MPTDEKTPLLRGVLRDSAYAWLCEVLESRSQNEDRDQRGGNPAHLAAKPTGLDGDAAAHLTLIGYRRSLTSSPRTHVRHMAIFGKNRRFRVVAPINPDDLLVNQHAVSVRSQRLALLPRQAFTFV